jgi:hypothetical protein
MPEYVAYRHDWDPSNQDRAQGLPEKMPVRRVQADSAEETCRLAAQRVPMAAGQHLSVEPAGRWTPRSRTWAGGPRPWSSEGRGLTTRTRMVRTLVGWHGFGTPNPCGGARHGFGVPNPCHPKVLPALLHLLKSRGGAGRCSATATPR